MSFGRRIGVVSVAVGLSGTLALVGAPRLGAQVAGGGGAGQGASAKPATGMILGRVVEAGGTTPVVGAIVTISGGPLGAAGSMFGAASGAGGPRQMETDSSGHFLFRELPKGTYQITATAAGYLPGRYGQTRLPARIERVLEVSRPVDLADGEMKTDTTIQMWKLGAIVGTVVDENGDPVVAVSVNLTAVDDTWGGRLTQRSTVTVTDDRGAFRFETGPGNYLVSVESTATTVPSSYWAEYRQHLDDGTSRAFGDSANAAGAPLPSSSGLHVGDRVLSLSSLGRGTSNGLPPWMVGRDGPVFMYPTTYYPSAATMTSAGIITVKSGEERGGVEIQLKPQATFRVSGRVTGPSGPVPGVGVRLVGSDWSRVTSPAQASDVAASVTDGNGEFTFFGVVPGQYTVRVLKTPVTGRDFASVSVTTSGGGMMMSFSSGGGSSGPPSLDPIVWATQPLTVGEANVNDLVVTAAPGGRISGRFEFIGAQPPAPDRIKAITVTARAVPGTMAALVAVTTNGGAVDEGGAFRTPQLVPGKYLVTASGAGGSWALKSAIVGGRDAADVPVDVDTSGIADMVLTFTTQQSTLTGTVTVDDATPRSGLPPVPTVVIFSTDQTYWPRVGLASRRVRTTSVGGGLTYRTGGLPAGDYFVAASTSDVDFSDPKVLSFLARTAARVTLAEGESRTQDVKSIEVVVK